MPSFHDSTVAAAPPEEVWKLLYDPSRFPSWWAGIETVETAPDPAGGDGPSYTAYPMGYPDFPMPQQLESRADERRVVISCLVSDLRFEWRLEPAADGTSTRITVDVDIPEVEAARLDTQRDVIATSLARLADLAARLSGSPEG